ncbi:kinase-like domain-containing protein [Thamnocephalis sphaerospora]|uniref:Kinase-like domain-containing protein n=1 Tax=Thamnocephalis sphaerospora TaxID=78915 RepID=A0A4P9XSB8_9FUNG|nr:kinase-like domain-containing protein [Thamnocephalis sphaerospora]|eukprot:RKP09015.1 kinase-like domain-containing protein [Thamnocephalis sphaerospora]
MRFLSTGSLYLVAAATLYLSHFSHAQQMPAMPSLTIPNTLPSKDTKTGGVPGKFLGTQTTALPQTQQMPAISGFIATRNYPSKDGKTHSASGKYFGTQVYIKCTTDAAAYNREKIAINAIQAGNPVRFGMTASVKKAFPVLYKVLEPPIIKQYCLIYNEVMGVSLDKHIASWMVEKRNAMLPNIFAQIITALNYMHRLGWVHNDITLSNILVGFYQEGTMPQASIVDFGSVQRDGERLLPPPASTFGYRPLEDYDTNALSHFKRDVWMLGATVYASMADMPPYGYEKPISQGREEIWTESIMPTNMRTRGDSFLLWLPKNTGENLRTLAKTLLVTNLSARPYFQQLSAKLLYSLSAEGGKRRFLGQTLGKLIS